MAGTRRLTQLVESVLDRLALPEGPLVVALSGGADSAALAFLCRETEPETRCVHVNHGLVGSPLMQRAAEEVADALSLGLEVREVEVPAGPSPEGQARRARYEALAGFEGNVLTAHTRDDSVETVLLNVIRGTGPRGLAGIPYYRHPNVFRPLLSITRSEARELAILAGLPFVDDPMNEDLALRRNMVRSRVIPMLSELNPRLSESIAKMAGAVASDNEYLDRSAAAIPILVGEDSHAVAVGDLVAAPKPMRDRALKRLLVEAVERGGVTAERVEGLWSVATGEVESQQIEGAIVAFRRGPLLVVGLSESPVEQSVELGVGRHRQGRIEFEVTAINDVCTVVPLSRWAAIFPIGTSLEATSGGWVKADGEPAWKPGEKRLPTAWYEPGSVGYLSVFASEVTGWTSSH